MKVLSLNIILLSVFFVHTSFSEVINGIDLEQMRAKFETEGITGEVHGAAKDFNHFVFTYRDPNNFFNHLQFSMIPVGPSMKSLFSTLGRHDKILIRGKFSSHNPSHFIHLYISEIKILEKYQGMPQVYPPANDDTLDELKAKTTHLLKVHSVVYDGKVLAIEYKNSVFPLFVKNVSLIENLYRNDIIQAKIRVKERPKGILHLELREDLDAPLIVVDKTVDGHNDPLTIEGDLVLFPKSPQLMFNVFALRVYPLEGLDQNYTIVNFEDLELFKSILGLLQELWDLNEGTAVFHRNKWVNPRLKLKISGIKNVVSPLQANPQIIVNDLKDIQLIF